MVPFLPHVSHKGEKCTLCKRNSPTVGKEVLESYDCSIVFTGGLMHCSHLAHVIQHTYPIMMHFAIPSGDNIGYRDLTLCVSVLITVIIHNHVERR